MNKATWQQDINRVSLAVARQNVGLTTVEATRRIIAKNPKGVDRVSLWESGKASPTYRQLEKLADIYNVNPLQLLLDDNLPAASQPSAFRSDQTKTSGYNLQRFISVLRVRQAVLSQNLQRDGASKNELAGSGRQFQDPEDLAEFIGQKIGYDIDKKPARQDTLKYLRNLLHDCFVFVFKTMSTARDLIDTPEMKGLYLHDDYAPCIAINRRDYKASQLFSLAHEIAHLFRAEEKIDSIDFRKAGQIQDSEESFCNQTAAALLIPKNQVKAQKHWDLEDVKELAKSNKTSSLMALYRLDSLGQLDKETKGRYSNQISQEFEEYQESLIAKTSSQENGGGNYYNNMRDSNGSLFNGFIFGLEVDGNLSAVEAQNLLRMPLQEIEL